MINSMGKTNTYKVLVFLFILGLGGGIALGKSNLFGERCDASKFHFVKIELGCVKKYIVKKSSYESLKNKLEDFINEEVKSGEIKEASMYFRDLENGPTLGLNEHASFAPASLLKVPVFLTYLKLAEDNPGIL